jgi:hypothetical protein
MPKAQPKSKPKAKPKAKTQEPSQPSVGAGSPFANIQGACDGTWEMLSTTLLEACRDGSLAARPEAGPEHAAALLAVLEGHPDIAGGLYRAGFLAAIEFAMDAMNAMADQVARMSAAGEPGCPIHRTAGCDRRVGRA